MWCRHPCLHETPPCKQGCLHHNAISSQPPGMPPKRSIWEPERISDGTPGVGRTRRRRANASDLGPVRKAASVRPYSESDLAGCP